MNSHYSAKPTVALFDTFRIPRRFFPPSTLLGGGTKRVSGLGIRFDDELVWKRVGAPELAFLTWRTVAHPRPSLVPRLFAAVERDGGNHWVALANLTAGLQDPSAQAYRAWPSR